ncbi:MAG: glycoside hydrolase family 2 TIM barrel-domain containing protein [Acidimicrobiales bacterium]
MRRTSLDDGWTVSQKTNRFAERMGLGPEPTAVTLPHDAMIGTERSPSGNPASAYFPGGTWEYRRTLAAPSDGAGTCVLLEFEGVYRDALVFVNDSLAAHRAGGYSDFVVPIDHLLRPGETNDLRVEARAHDDSRWYSGAGIYRSVWLLQAGRVHLEPAGVQVTAAELDDEVAVVSVAAIVSNHSTTMSRAVVRVEVCDADGRVCAQVEAPVTTFPGDALTARQRLWLEQPHRWDPDDPYLYTCRVTVRSDDEALDQETTTFGLRSLSVDPARGLRINGRTVLLRGACVHHDNGLLGAATIRRAEERRIELLKAAGFNAIRSAHNPVSKPMLDACDRLGVLVMDETFDMWVVPKSEHDYALRFHEAWEDDVEAMVRKDVNHPSVILYSIGNEVPEAGRPYGARVGRAVAEKIRSLDHTRLVTQAVSGLLVGGPELFAELRRDLSDASGETDEQTGVNTALTNLADLMNNLMVSPLVAQNSAETMSYLDVAGYNYMESRYEMDRGLFPARVIVGSETHPAAIDTGWAEVRRHPHVIGDFTWTGWDYLGEVGVGRTVYGGPEAGPPAFNGAFPWLTAWCGDIDITGHRRPQSFYREIVFGLRSDPFVAVRRPQHHGERGGTTPWSWSDSVSSWSWDGFEGKPVTVEVYADADEVELLVNGRSLGRRPAGAEHRYRAEFEAVFEPGLVEAVAWRGHDEIGRTGLRSASGPVRLEARVDRPEIAPRPDDLAFVELGLTDARGAPYRSADRKVHVEVLGPAVLQALGSANPESEEGFGGPDCTTFDGRALAVVRPTGEGRITVTATIEGCDPQHVRIDARA